MIRIRWFGVLFVFACGAVVGGGLTILFGDAATAVMGVIMLGAGLADVFIRPAGEGPADG